MDSLIDRPVPRWVHGLALLTVVAAVPLFFLGADVTTKGAGMADQRAFVPFWQAIHEMVTGEQSHGWLIEHSHRLAGWFIGLCGIALCASLWLTEPRRWVRWLGTAALALIVVQGLLGIFRVRLNDLLGPNLAWLHGSFAPLVLATLVAIAVVTGKTWTAGGKRASARDRALRRLALWSCVVIYGQLVVGGMVRHRDFFWGARLHLCLAFAVVAVVMPLAARIYIKTQASAALASAAWASPGALAPGVTRCNWTLLALLATQLLVGIETWLSRFYHPVLPWNQLEPLLLRPEIVRTFHFVLGSFLFATSVALAVHLHRPSPKRQTDAILPLTPMIVEQETEVLV
jgi:cytochrome c oxidase assembly protein subunit 15